MTLGLLLVLCSGIANGLFTAPMKIIPRWKWENIWAVFILTACVAMPWAMASTGAWRVISAAPEAAVRAAAGFGFAWGFGAILFGLSVHTLGVSLANSIVLGISSGLGSLVPLLLGGPVHVGPKLAVLFFGVFLFLVGVTFCGQAGRLREPGGAGASARGLLFATGSGVMSAVFNIGYALAAPIARTGESMGLAPFAATNNIWLLMLGAGAIPNLAYCGYLMWKNGSAGLLAENPGQGWGWSILTGLLWGGSIFLYGAATPRLGRIGPSIGWPMSLATGLLVANLMGVLLGEWRQAPAAAKSRMRAGIVILIAAILACAASSGMAE